MTTSRDHRLGDALADARDLPDGEARCAELERIAAQADATGDAATGLAARLALVGAHLHDGQRWRLLEPVRRCVAALDRTPGLRAARPELTATLHRHQRYAVEAFLGTPRIGLDQARSLLDDLADRLGPDAGPVAELRCRIADHLGDEPTARREYDRWHATSAGPPVPGDPEGSDPVGVCPGCAPARRAELRAGWGEHAEALAELRPALDGEVGCTDQPERALTVALLPWLRAGEPERAARAHLRAYRRHRRERAAFPQLAAHLRFCALGGHLDRGLDILAEQLPRLDDPYDDLSAMEFAAAGALLCGLAADAGLGGRRLHRPAYGARPAAEVDTATLGAELLAVATELAGSFDARNGTGHQSGRIASWLAERPLAAAVPLPDDDEPDGWPDPTGPVDDATAAEDEPAPLGLALVTAALDRRGDGYAVEPDGTVVGRWGEAVIQFRRLGRRGEVLHARVVAIRRLPAGRLAEAYAFCNAWNHDRLLPKAYVHEPGDGTLVLAGDVTTDLAYGVAPTQLVVLLTATVSTGVAYAEAVAALP